MKPVEFLNPTITRRGMLVLGLIVLAGAPIAYVLADPLGLLAARDSIRKKLRAGLTEPEVIRLLGQDPTYRYARGDAPADYYVDGWARRERPITGTVLIFLFGEPICYVWFDGQGHVEDYFVGGS